jgi:hypothetical protein
LKNLTTILLPLFIGLIAIGCSSREKPEKDLLVGAWKGKVQFKSGAFAAVKDLEFMYVFNDGGTMTESSNYDGAPPVPPAYGIWKKTGPRQFEVRYEFYMTKPPTGLEEITKGGGWMPAGHGVLVETITVSGDGRSFTSRIVYDAFDKEGTPTQRGSEAEVEAHRMTF